MSTVFVSAGEPSGDAHAAALIAALRARRPDLAIEGVGGPRMAAAGASLMARIEGLTAIGFVEVLGKVPAHLRLQRAIRGRLARGDVGLVVLVDYPGFHLRLAAMARAMGVPVFYYIAPQLWAWHESRVRRLARDVRRLGVILPFEEAFFRARGVEATFVGHPLLDRAPPPGGRAGARGALGLDPLRPVLGLFPGSRAQEVARLWPLFREAAALAARRVSGLQVVCAAASGARYPDPGPVRLVADRPAECFAAAGAALCKSGTTTLEAALAGAPQVIAYRMNPLSYQLARRLVRVPHIGLVNLVAERRVAPEFVQAEATAAALAAALTPLLDEDSPERAAQLAGIAEVRRRLGGPGAAERAAAIAAALVAA